MNSTTTRIVVLDGITLNPGDNPWTGLERYGTVEVYDRTSPELVVERARDAQILVINKIRLTREVFEALPQLRFVAVTATGVDCVDLSTAAERGVPVANVPIYGTESVAQHVFAMLLHIVHRVDLHDQAVRDGEWQRRGDFSFWLQPLTELAGKTMGIVGFGRIGRQVGVLAHALGMSVLAHSRTMTDPPEYQPFAWASMDELTRQADVISLNCPLTDATRGIVGAEFLQRVKPTAILLNASRGPLVDEAALAAALVDGRLAAAGLDVVSQEPINADNPLLRAPRCFITPHQAWATREARHRLMEVTVANVGAFLGGDPQNLITPK